MNAAGHPTRHRREYRESADDCCLPGASSLELAEFLGVAPLPATPPVVFCSFPDPLYRYERIILPGVPALEA
jgi:hypothetical protein